MKVILLQDVEKLGKTGEIKEVAPGYGRNFLIPKGLVVLASPFEIKRYQEHQAKLKTEKEEKIKKTRILEEELKKLHLVFKVKTSQEDKIFGSVTASDVASELSKKGFEINKKDIKMETVKKTGTYPVLIDLGEGIKVKLKVIVNDATPTSY